MRLRIGVALAIASLLTSSLTGGCNKKEAGPPPPETPEPVAQAPAPGPTAEGSATQSLLSLVPADATATGAVLDWSSTYRLLGDLQISLARTKLGRMLVKQLRDFTGKAPVPLPWSLEELTLLGLDPKGPMAVFGHDKPVVVFSVRDGAAFKRNLARIWGGEKAAGTWSSETAGAHTLAVLRGQQTIFCLFQDRRLICSPDRARLLSAVERRPEDSLWGALDPEERKQLSGATALLSGHGAQMGGRVALAADGDGATLRLRLESSRLAQLLPVLDDKGTGTLLGLGKDADALVYLRISIGALLRLGRGYLPAPRELGVDPLRLQAASTGEIILVERPRGQAMLVVGLRDQKVSQELVEAVAGILARPEVKARTKPRVTPVLRNEGKMFRIRMRSPLPELPISLDLGLAAGPAGLMVGSFDLVQEASLKKTPPVADFLATLESPVEREVFGPKTVLAARSFVGDPLKPVARALETVLREQLGGKSELAVEGLQLGRFLLEQMHRQTVGISRSSAQGLSVLMRLSTLHEAGDKASDDARDLWHQALESEAEGDLGAYREAVARLGSEYAETRYARLAERSMPGLLGRVLASAMMAGAVPAFLRYRQSADVQEARENLARISSLAQARYEMTRSLRSANAPAAGFPGTTPFTPEKPCCNSGGLCQPDPTVWEHETWRVLGFSIPRPHRFQYRFVNQGKGFLAQAQGDLGCNGNPMELGLQGVVGLDGKVQIRPAPAAKVPLK